MDQPETGSRSDTGEDDDPSSESTLGTGGDDTAASHHAEHCDRAPRPEHRGAAGLALVTKLEA